ncbi:MAG: DMT family transporter [Eubacteriales bacterium]|nr:DMT family transporter [Eubacteriales bacterium]
MKQQSQLTGHLLALFSVLVWGTTFVSTKVLLRTFSPVEIMVMRFALGFLALLLVGRGWLKTEKKAHELYFAAAGLTGVTLYFLMENIALTYASASLIGVVVSVAPLFTAIAAGVLLGGEPLGRWFFAGFACAISGVALVSFSGVSELHFGPLGALLGVLAALVWGVYSAIVRKISSFGYQTVPATCRVFFYGLLFLVPCAVWDGFPAGLAAWAQPLHLANLLFLGLCASAACFVTWNSAVRILGAVKTSVYVYIVPVVTIVFSALILHETMTPMMAAGTALALAGLFLSERRERAPESEMR